MYKNKKVVAIEGGEGTGKGTLINKLKEIYPDALFIMEPGWGSDKAMEIRQDIMSGEKSEEELITLFAQARNEIEQSIPDNVELIFSDRTILSSLAYQTFEHTYDYVLNVNKELVSNFTIPTYSILLSGDVKAIQKRLHSSSRDTNWLDHQSLEKHIAIDKKYHNIMNMFYQNNDCLILDNSDLKHSINPEDIIYWINNHVLRDI